MNDTITTALRKAGAISDDEINAAVEAVIGGDARADYPITEGYTLDISKALDIRKPYREALSSDIESYKRNMVRTAVLLASLDKA